ncbi:MAG: PxKF domain-containing protein [Armatimonadota bacterium]|nr:PxKF domain-containing protein [Armatimonadota bacterium]MDR7452158.1 PxKF domain-containing protein [Armatimonadota bacterium]MDR7494884.1 PxKF domain-containing protein [Armatimonadota bacterium]MDR7500281.1 PxKF domain-containing protein [Armatimonadota bacterium]MDR7547776.1 PxKF domain-containing protein [Armatimonadota bacterium]
MRHRIRGMLVAFLVVGLAAAAGAAPFAYVTNSWDHTVSVIDTATNAVVATLAVGRSPWGVVVSGDGTRVYVANQSGNSVSVIDAASRSILTTIPVGSMPYGVALNPAGTRLYVTNFGGNSVSVVDTAANRVVATVAVGIGPRGVEVSPDGSQVFVVNFNGSPEVSVIDAATNTVAEWIDGDPAAGATGAALSPDGGRLYVTEYYASRLRVFDTTTNAIVASIPVGVEPQGVAVNPTGTRVYVANNGSESVSVIDAATNTKLPDILLPGSAPFGVAVSSDGRRIFVVDGGQNRLVAIDAATNGVVASVPVGNMAVGFGRFVEPSKSSYRFLGFFPRPRHNPVSARAGARITLRWQIEDATGQPVKALSAVSSIQVGKIACPSGPVSGVVSARGRLRYVSWNRRDPHKGPFDRGAFADDEDDEEDDEIARHKDDNDRAWSWIRRGYYRYTWQTERSWRGSCRRFIVTLDDGSAHTLDFRFR